MRESVERVPGKLPRRAVCALAVSLLLAGFMVYATSTWPDKSFSFPFWSKARWCAAVVFAAGAGVFAARARRMSRAGFRMQPREAVFAALGAGLAISLFTSAAAHPWFFLYKWFTRGAGLLPVSSATIFALLAGALALAPFARRMEDRAATRLLALLLVALQAAAFAALLRGTGFSALYRDDHPSFMFRIREFVETYPAMTDFNPWWNAGVVNAVGASSGVGAVALPFFPLWRLFPVHLVYTPLVGLLFIVVAPLLTMAGLRAARASWPASLTGAILSLGVSRAIFVWGLHFGTVGAVAAMSFLPLFALLLYRAFILRRAGWGAVAALAASAFFLAQWPPCVLMAALLLPGCLLNARRFRLRAASRILVAICAASLLLLPNIVSLLASRDLFQFVAADSAANARHVLPGVGEWLRALPATFALRFPEMHPLVLFLGIGGVCFLPQRRLRLLLAPAVFGLLLLSAWGPLVAPRMQLGRMALPAALLAVIPAAILAGRALARGPAWTAYGRAVVLALLLLGGMTVVALYGGAGYAPYTSLPPEIRAFAETVRREVPQDGRLLFYGKTVHSFGGGHVAYLPILAGREMMACDYYHFPPKMVEYDYPPKPWRKTAAGIADFMRLHGATHLATTIPHRAAFIRESGLFTEVVALSRKKFDPYHISLFALKGATGGRIHSGDATLGAGAPEAEFNHLRVHRGADSEAVLRYNWNPNLTAGDTAELEPVEVAPGVTFIRVRFTGGDNTAVIRYGGKGR